MAISTRQVLQLRHLSASFGISAGGLAVSNVVSNHGHGWTNRTVDQVLTGTIGRLDLVTKNLGLTETAAALTWGANDYLAAETTVRGGVEALDQRIKAAAETKIGLVDAGGTFTNTFSSTNHIGSGDTYKLAIEKLDAVAGEVSSSLTTVLASANVTADTFLEVYNAYSAISGAVSDTYSLRLNDSFGDVINSDGQWDATAVHGDGATATYLTGSSLTGMLGDIDHLLAEVSGTCAALPVLFGVADRATNLGAFDEAIIDNNVTVKAALQALETDLADVQTFLGVNAEVLSFVGGIGSIIPRSATVSSSIAALEVDASDVQTLLGVPAESTDLGSFSGDILSDTSTAKAAFQALETELSAVQTLLGVTPGGTAMNFATFEGDVIPNATTVSGALSALETRVDAIKSDFRAAHVSGSDGQVYAGYALGFGAGSPQMRMVKDHDGHVNVYFEIR